MLLSGPPGLWCPIPDSSFPTEIQGPAYPTPTSSFFLHSTICLLPSQRSPDAWGVQGEQLEERTPRYLPHI